MIIYNMPMDEYHADTAISNSKIKVFANDGPQRFYRQYIAKDLPGEDSPAFAFGRAFDDRLFLSPPEFGAAYSVQPSGLSLATKEGKAWLKWVANQDIEVTPWMALVNAIKKSLEAGIFNPDTSAFAMKPEGMSVASKEGKAWKEANEGKTIIAESEWMDAIRWAEEYANEPWCDITTPRQVISADDNELMSDMVESIKSNQFAMDLLSIGRPQVTIRREVPDLGIVAQSRPDWFSDAPFLGLTEGPYILDLKTTSDLDSFDRNAINFGYGRQLAMAQYLLAQEGIIADAFLLVVEKKRAGRCRVRRLPEVALAAGFAQFRRYGAEIGRRMAANDWTDRQMAIEECRLTSWQEKELTEEARV